MGELHGPAGKGDPFELLARLEAGADPNDATGRAESTPLIKASSCDNITAARILLRFGARTDVQNSEGHSPLSLAPSEAMRRILLEAGADPDFGRFDGRTLAAEAAALGKRELVDLYLSFGANPEAETENGKTILELLEDEAFPWCSSDERPNKLRYYDPEIVLPRIGNLQISPEEFVSRGKNISWGMQATRLQDPLANAWGRRVVEILITLDLREQAYRQYLQGEELAQALRSLTSIRQVQAKADAKGRRFAGVEAVYFGTLMNASQMIQTVVEMFDQVETVEVDGATFFFYGDERMFPFATLITKNDDYEKFSDLNRPGVYRLNFELSKPKFREMFPGTEDVHDFTVLNLLMPHPTYGKNSWVSILNPSPETFETLRPLLTGSYELGVLRQERKS